MSNHQNIIPGLRYNNAPEAIEWLCRALGFKEHLVVPGNHGTISHAQLKLGGGMIMLGSARDDIYGKNIKSPTDLDGINSQSAYIVLDDSKLTDHYKRAVEEGAEILMPLESQEYGGRNYTCRDPEGHIWSFGSYDPYE